MFEVEGLTVNYEKDPVLWDVSFSLPSGVLCGIAGPNGAGKSTLLKTAMGLLNPISGEIRFQSKRICLQKNQVAYVPQRESIDWEFPITAFDVVLMGRYARFGLFCRPRKADREAAEKALDQVGMTAYASRQIDQLSGGQQQRLFIARALVQNPQILLMDEPFSGIDLGTEKEIIEILRSLRAVGKTILIVFHDLPSCKEYFDWVVLLNRRLIACGPTREVFNQENLIRTFGKSQPLFEEVADLSAKIQGGFV